MTELDEEPQPETESEEEEDQDAGSRDDEWEETVHQPHQGEEGQDVV